MSSKGAQSFTYTSEDKLSAQVGVSYMIRDAFGRVISYSDYAAGNGTSYSILRDGPDGPDALKDGPDGFVFAGTNEPIAWYDSSGARHFLHADERGSIVAVTDSAGGLTGINKYDDYGQVQGTLTGKFGYAGLRSMSFTTLYDDHARVYDPELGRFMQTDPIGYDGDGPNLYAYTLNNPVNYVDPLGLDDGTCGGNGCDTPINIVKLRDDGFWILGTLRTFVNPIPGDGGMQGGAGCAGDCRPIDVVGKRPQKTNTHTCPKGGWVTASIGGSATGAFLYGAFSVGAEVGVSLPTNFFSTGSLRGLQFYGSVSFQGLAGLGFFAGAGATPSIGYSNGPIQSGASGSHVVGGGAALGAGGEASVATNGSGGSVSGGPEAGVGAYAGYGGKVSGTAATPQIGCTP